MKKTACGRLVYPRLVAWIIGGTYEQPITGGYGWQPPLWRLVWRYYREGWRQHGYTLWRFIAPPFSKHSDVQAGAFGRLLP